ncbi:tape measure protein [Vibrio gallicus]|uniref:tape measure protein n=1 Tax=Vibrio gallicus TaxID=190897 RepID=UPI0021C2ABE7|nr:tape measure protein [Vibrio gallicus]
MSTDNYIQNGVTIGIGIDADSWNKFVNKDVPRDADKVERHVKGMEKGVNSSFSNMAKSALKVSIALTAIAQTASTVFNEGNNYLAMQKSMAMVSDSTAQLNSRLAFTRDLANQTGANLASLGKDYANFVASNPDAGGMSEEQMQMGYGAVVRRSSAMGATQDDIKGVTRAITQMLSKGKISAEELRGQLGERMSGATKLFAEGLGVTTQQLNTMLEKGELISASALPKFFERVAKANGNMSDAFDNSRVSLGKLKNTITEESGQFMGAGGDEMFQGFIEGTNKLIASVGGLAQQLAPVFNTIGRIFYAVVTTMSDGITEITLKIIEFKALLMGWGFFDGDGVKDFNEQLSITEKIFGVILGHLTAMKVLSTVKALREMLGVGKGGKPSSGGKTPTKGVGKAISKGTVKLGVRALPVLGGLLTAIDLISELPEREHTKLHQTNPSANNSIFQPAPFAAKDSGRYNIDFNPTLIIHENGFTELDEE